MLLKKIVLENIRSYTREEIIFPEGSIILSGDIGSGKSSILLAIEFALFGTSRPDLPGELLLRKGAKQGSVELNLIINNQEVSIKRNLKKEKENIKQPAGHIIINNLKKDLMPGELKTEVFKLLGYPEDLISKNKNYLFRYTIYTPQEEMKFVLQENPEVRLDTLRKIFDIDKYKNVRDNLQVYLKNMRMKIAILNTKTEPLEEERKKLEEVNKENEELQKSLTILLPKKEEADSLIAKKKEEIALLEKKEAEFLKNEQNYKNSQIIIKGKTEQLILEQQKKEQLSLQISAFSFSGDKNEISREVQELELKRKKIISEKSTLQEQINQQQLKIRQQQEEIAKLGEEMLLLPEKEKEIATLSNQIATKQELQEKKKHLEELFQKTLEISAKNLTILNQSKELSNKILSLDNCPLCLQDVSHNHKEKISNQEQEKIKQSENLLFESNKKKEEISQQKAEVSKKIEEIVNKEKILAKLRIECSQLQEKKSLFEKKKEELPQLAKWNNLLMEQLENLPQDTNLEKNLKEKRDLLEKLSKKEFLQKQLGESLSLQEKLNIEIRKINHEKEALELWLSQQENPKEKITLLRELLQADMDKEKELALQQMELKTNLQNLIRRAQEIKTTIEKLKEGKNQLIKYKEHYNWLDKFFLNLTYAIEKQIMYSIHRLFNQLFQEWFAILIDDDQIYAKIDDGFSPVIEQNGYEIGFNNLSGGEKTSAALAYRLALNRVINDVIHQIRTKDVLILDEPTDGFSTDQLDKVRDVLDKLSLRQTIIVSHESKIESFVENIIRIRKEGHISQIV